MKPGMYHVQHQVTGDGHAITFKPVTMPAGYREYQMTEGKEVVRVKCNMQAVAKALNSTRVTLGRNASGEVIIKEVQIAGETIKHIF